MDTSGNWKADANVSTLVNVMVEAHRKMYRATVAAIWAAGLSVLGAALVIVTHVMGRCG